jgi:phospholipid-binding lipoprotein MlaA
MSFTTPLMSHPFMAFSKKTFRQLGFYCSVLLGLVGEHSHAQGVADPLEDINRAVFAFNDTADKYVIKPLATGYDKVLPDPAQQGVGNFFNNLWDVNRSINASLQGEFKAAGTSISRVLINSTLGFFGFFDVATDMGIDRYRTDFGHTLAEWGVGSGPYLVLPFLGPNTLRSSVGTIADGYASPQWYLVNDSNVSLTLLATNIIDTRARFLSADEIISGDRYIFFRDVYLQRREALISGGQPTDSFSDFDDEWDDDSF